jgi:hypothetical protein
VLQALLAEQAHLASTTAYLQINWGAVNNNPIHRSLLHRSQLIDFSLLQIVLAYTLPFCFKIYAQR